MTNAIDQAGPRKVVLITGAGGGIGAATARQAAAAGFAVCLNHRGTNSIVEELVVELTTTGASAMTVRADIGDPDAIDAMFRDIDAHFGRLDALVNNAGVIGWEGSVADVVAGDLARLWATNVTGYFLCAREAVRRMSISKGGRGGVIVNVSSLAARTGGKPGRVHYAASKGAIDAFTRGLAREVAGEGIRVNAVAPGLIETGIHASIGKSLPQANGIPLGRSGRADEVAAAIIWLMSDQASYVAGANLEIGGGV